MTRKEEAPQVTYQAIIVLKGTKPEEVAKEMVMAGMTVLHQYNAKANSYVGSFEAGEFTKHWDSWVKDNDFRQEVFFAEEIHEMNEISYLAENESVPMNAFSHESTVLVLGPFTAERLDFFTQNFEKA